MDAFKKLSLLAIALVVFAISACEEEVTTPDPPPPAAKISLSRISGISPDPDPEKDRSDVYQLHSDVHDIMMDSKNRLWVVTQGGVMMVDGSTKRGFHDRDGIPNRQCRTIVQLKDRYYVGTWDPSRTEAWRGLIQERSSIPSNGTRSRFVTTVSHRAR